MLKKKCIPNTHVSRFTILLFRFSVDNFEVDFSRGIFRAKKVSIYSSAVVLNFLHFGVYL